MNTYLFSYQYQGARVSLKIPAESQREAEARLKVMPWGKCDGILFATIPAITGDWLPSLVCRIRDWFRAEKGLREKTDG